MAIKEELEQEVKEEGGGKDELEALDALEKEAAEYNKACSRASCSLRPPDLYSGCRDRPHTQSFQARRVSAPLHQISLSKIYPAN